MAFEDLQDQLKDKWQEFKAQLDDNPTFNTLKERFETLNPSSQKTIVWSGIVVFSLMMLSCPYSYWSTSTDYVAEYESTRDMIRDLLRTSLANQQGDTPEPLDDAQLRSEINRILVDTRLLQDQTVSIEQANANEFGAPLAPKSINQEGWEIQLKQLNTRQIVEVGQKLQSLHAGVKLAGMALRAHTADPRYYDATFRMIKFSLPVSAATAEDKGPRNRSRNNNEEDN